MKIVLNDPIEEEKQEKIQLDQIKFWSRSMYNSQMQLNKLKMQISTSTISTPQRDTVLTPIGRLCHTMRLVNKSIRAFADFYPYRSDNDPRSEKLCFHFYKQVHSCVDHFNQCILTVLAFTNVIGKDFLTNLKFSKGV